MRTSLHLIVGPAYRRIFGPEPNIAQVQENLQLTPVAIVISCGPIAIGTLVIQMVDFWHILELFQ